MAARLQKIATNELLNSSISSEMLWMREALTEVGQLWLTALWCAASGKGDGAGAKGEEWPWETKPQHETSFYEEN